MSREHRTLLEWSLPSLGIAASDRVLDVGCGGGLAVKMIGALTPQGSVAAIDHSPAMVAQATSVNRRLVRDGRAELQVASVEDLPFPDASFDKATAVETFIFWDEPVRGLREIHRVLKPGGTLAIILEASGDSPNRAALEASAELLRYTLYSGSEIKALATSAGFTSTDQVVDPDRGRGWLCVLATK